MPVTTQQIERWLKEDLGHHDVTNQVPGETSGRLLAKEDGVIVLDRLIEWLAVTERYTVHLIACGRTPRERDGTGEDRCYHQRREKYRAQSVVVVCHVCCVLCASVSPFATNGSRLAAGW